MSEEKVIHHAENALHVLQNKEKGLLVKAKEFFWEIFIIVIAVSITLLLHNWNDHLHELHLEREFLAGIKSDLDSGALYIQEDVGYFKPSVDYFTNVCQQLGTHQVNTAYLDSNSGQLLNTLYLGFDMGRFEGFKSSGYLRLIENQTLLKHLMSLYTIAIPFQLKEDQFVFDDRRRYYNEHIGPKSTFDFKGGMPKVIASKLIDDPEFRYYIIFYSNLLKEKQRQNLALAKAMKKLSAEIGAELDK